jgi:alpha-ribazole phosphatase
MTTLWLVRHSAPTADFLAEARCYGVSEVPLDYEHLAESVVRLRAVLPRCNRYIVSPRQRCRAMADALSSGLDFPQFQVDERITEMNFGCWENTRWADLPREALDAWAENFWAYRVHGGESVLDFVIRVKDALYDVFTQGRGEATLWITHQGVIRVVRAFLSNEGLSGLSGVSGIGFGDAIQVHMNDEFDRCIERTWRAVAREFIP